MSEDLKAFDTWASHLLSKLDGSARRAALRDVAKNLQASQRKRIASNRNPDGSAYAKRKPRLKDKVGRIKRGAMFPGLRKAKYLKAEVTSEGVAVGFAGRIARVARVHQYGLTDAVSKGGPQHRYAERVLLGFTDADHEMIADVLLKHLAP
jgi:phage virion morphogenesis protein